MKSSLKVLLQKAPYFYKPIYSAYSTARWSQPCLTYKHALPKETPAPPIHLIWYSEKINFGDTLSPLLFKILSKRKLSTGIIKKKNSSLLAIGSIMHRAETGNIIWGSGVRDDQPLKAKNLDVKAVRGPLTRKFLLSHNIECPEIYGDPAILLPYVYRPKISGKRYRVGIIKHFADRTNFEKFSSHEIKEINIRPNPLRIVDDILNCDLILSSSLHGIIVAEAYKIPACWMSPQVSLWTRVEPVFKYHDYYLSTERDAIPYEYSTETLDIDTAVETALKNKKPKIDSERLLLSFPFLRPEIKSLKNLSLFEVTDALFNLSPLKWFWNYIFN